MHLAFYIFLAADLFPVLRDAADIPVAVPQYSIAGYLHLVGQLMIMFGILSLPKDFRQRNKMLQCPIMQEAYHGALTAAQVQTVVPVRPKPLADTVVADLLRTEIQNPLQMFVYALRCLVPQYIGVGVSELFPCKIQISGLFYVLYHRAYQPQGII